MKRIEDKQIGFVDYIGTWNEFVPYFLGCPISGDSKKLRMRVYGPVPNLKHVLLLSLPKRLVKKRK